MGYSLTVQRLCLLTLTILAPIAMHRLGLANGLFDHLPNYNRLGALLPGTNTVIKIPRTGITKVDDYLSFMVSLFWIDLDSRNVKPHIQGTHFYGTLSSIWLLMLVEAHRAGRKPWFIFATYAIETYGEFFGLGFFTPIWCLVQLSAASSALRSAKKQAKPDESLYLADGNATAISFAYLLGFGIPTAMMFASQPGHAPLWSTQTWVLLRLIHPVFVWAVWAVLAPRRKPSSTAVQKPGNVSWSKARTLQRFYTASILLSAIGHLLSSAPLIQTVMEPRWLTPDVARQLHPSDIFKVGAFWLFEPVKIRNFAEGVSIFLQWDEIFAATSIIVWAFGSFISARAEVRAKPGLLSTVLQMIGVGIFAGPGAVAAFLISERDSLVFEQASEAGLIQSKKL